MKNILNDKKLNEAIDFFVEQEKTNNYKNITLELNLGCQNVDSTTIPYYILKLFIARFKKIIVKLPCNEPDATEIFLYCYNLGVRTFNICNTLKTDNGSESSRRIQDFSLKLIEDITNLFKDVVIIGGGGMYTSDDVKRYREAGADGFSISTGILKPWNIPGIINEVYK